MSTMLELHNRDFGVGPGSAPSRFAADEYQTTYSDVIASCGYQARQRPSNSFFVIERRTTGFSGYREVERVEMLVISPATAL